MPTAPAFQFYARDFIVGTLGMTTAEVGLYIRALAVAWDSGPLPLDEATLARTLMVPVPEFRKLWRVVSTKFEATDNGFVNLRLEQERSHQAAYREQQSHKGQASAKARWGNRSGNQKVTTVTPRLQPEGSPNGNSASAICDLHTASVDQEPDQKPRRSERAVSVLDVGPDDLMELWNAYAIGLPKCRELSPKRKVQAAARLRERPALADWREIVGRIAASDFCRGVKPGAGTWVATFDWLLKPDTALMVLEGKYDNRQGAMIPMTKGARTMAAGARLQAALDAGAELDPFGTKAHARKLAELAEKASA